MAAFVLLRYARVSRDFSILRPRELDAFSGRQSGAVGTTEAGEPTKPKQKKTHKPTDKFRGNGLKLSGGR